MEGVDLFIDSSKRGKKKWRWNIGYAALDSYCRTYDLTRDEFLDLVESKKLIASNTKRCDNEYEVEIRIDDEINNVPVLSYVMRKSNSTYTPDNNGNPNCNDNNPETIKKLLYPKTAKDYLLGASYIWEYPEKIGDRIKEGLFFQPWGTPKDGKMNKRMDKALDTTTKLLRGLRKYEINPKLIIMPADEYATRIDGWNQEIVTKFINELSDRVSATNNNLKIEVVPYSQIMEENKELYEEIKSGINVDYINSCLDINKINRAQKYVADKDPTKAANEYIFERLIEGLLVEEKYRPIKTSLASHEKDELDGPLPRVYFNKTPRFPWIASRWN